MSVLSFLLRYRWIVAVIIVPLSFFYDVFWFLRSQLVLFLGSAPDHHHRRVQHVQRQVREWRERGDERKMCTARPQWMSISAQRLLYKERCHGIEVNLMDILKIDKEQMIVRCEPLVTVKRLLQALIPHNLTLPIVPEIGDLTIGGLVMGGGIETTSHKVGIWHHICTYYEMVLADGSVIECTEKSNSDLFYAIPWSYGTLGFLTAVDIKLHTFKPYIRLTYSPHLSMTSMMEDLQREMGGKEDSLEGIMYDKQSSVVMKGTFTQHCEKDKLNPIGKWYKPWFYTHVEKILKDGEEVVEYIPTYDFYFRHNKPYFWLAHDVVPFGNHPIFRYLLGWMLPYHYGFLKFLNQFVPQEVDDRMIVNDFGLTMRYLKKGLDFYDDLVSIYPIWLCPSRVEDFGPIKIKKTDEDYFLDIGVYGLCEKPDYNKREVFRKLEKFVLDNHGYQGLYSENFLTFEEFEAMFPGEHHKKMRQQLPLTDEAFPTLYEKVSKLGRS